MTNTIHTLIVDDEVAFLNTLEIMLRKFPQFEIVGKARSVNEAVEQIEQLQPHLLFLDVEMEDGTGFDVLRQIEHQQLKIIFVTAFNHYAVEAFKFSAVDYLLKPVVSDDLKNALTKVELAIKKDSNFQNFATLLENMHNKLPERKKIVLREWDTHHVIRLDQILWCTAEGSYTRFYLSGNKQILVSRNLKEFENMLGNNGFFRVHRSHLANLNKAIRFEKGESSLLHLEEDHQLQVSIRKRDQLAHMLAAL